MSLFRTRHLIRTNKPLLLIEDLLKEFGFCPIPNDLKYIQGGTVFYHLPVLHQKAGPLGHTANVARLDGNISISKASRMFPECWHEGTTSYYELTENRIYFAGRSERPSGVIRSIMRTRMYVIDDERANSLFPPSPSQTDIDLNAIMEKCRKYS